jgi:hypothetical protein
MDRIKQHFHGVFDEHCSCGVLLTKNGDCPVELELLDPCTNGNISIEDWSNKWPKN